MRQVLVIGHGQSSSQMDETSFWLAMANQTKKNRQEDANKKGRTRKGRIEKMNRFSKPVGIMSWILCVVLFYLCVGISLKYDLNNTTLNSQNLKFHNINLAVVFPFQPLSFFWIIDPWPIKTMNLKIHGQSKPGPQSEFQVRAVSWSCARGNVVKCVQQWNTHSSQHNGIGRVNDVLPSMFYSI